MAARVARRSHPTLRAVDRRLLANAKAPELALVVLMPKVLVTPKCHRPRPPALVRERTPTSRLIPYSQRLLTRVGAIMTPRFLTRVARPVGRCLCRTARYDPPRSIPARSGPSS
jgi:hypothetical protein